MTARTAAIGAGLPVRLTRTGPDDAPRRMLLLHGLANSSTVWDRFVATAGSGWQTIAADLPWRGGQIGVRAGSPEPQRWIDVALAQCGDPADHPVDVVVAHSYAAVLALLRFGHEPDLLRRHGITGLVLLAPFYRARGEEFEWNDLRRSMDGFESLMADGIRLHTEHRLPADRPADEHRMDLARRVCDRVGPYGWTDFFVSYLAVPGVPLDAFDVDILVATGLDDATAPSAEARALARGLPNARLAELPGCGHFPMSERPDALRTEIDRFTSTLPDPRPTNQTTGAVLL